MANDEQQGFDLAGTRWRLEEWFLMHMAFPASGDAQQWPGGRCDSVRVLFFEHWGYYIAAQRTLPNGWRKKRQFDVARGAGGVALAALEIDAYQTTVLEADETLRLEGNPLSRAVARYGRGRPRNLLADACAQQLRLAGFSYGDIAGFMGITVGAATWHCKAPDARSLLALAGPERPNFSAAAHR